MIYNITYISIHCIVIQENITPNHTTSFLFNITKLWNAYQWFEYLLHSCLLKYSVSMSQD